MHTWLQSWFETSWFDYPVKRNVALPSGPLRHFNIAVFILGIIYAIAITIVNIVAVGYETVAISSVNFTSTPLWYEKLIPKSSSLVPPSYNCSESVIKINEGPSP